MNLATLAIIDSILCRVVSKPRDQAKLPRLTRILLDDAFLLPVEPFTGLIGPPLLEFALLVVKAA